MGSPRSNRPATRLSAVALATFGLALVVLSLIADAIDLGGGKGFGYQQLIVLIVGLAMFLGGGAMLLQGRPGARRGTHGGGFEPER